MILTYRSSQYQTLQNLNFFYRDVNIPINYRLSVFPLVYVVYFSKFGIDLIYNNFAKKETGTANFDVPMGSYDRAEVYELVGCHILNQLNTVMRKELIGLYRDDGLDIMKNMSGPEIE